MDITKTYGIKVFSDAVMSQRLPRDVYESLKLTQRMGAELDSTIAGAVAAAMRDWAVEKDVYKRQLLGYPAVRAALQGIKPCLAGLILAAGVGLCSDAVFSGGSADPVAAAVLGALLLGELASLGLRKKPLAPGALIGASAVMGIALSLI